MVKPPPAWWEPYRYVRRGRCQRPRIKISYVETGLVRTTVSNSTGRYAAHELSIGRYCLRAEAPGYTAYDQGGITGRSMPG